MGNNEKVFKCKDEVVYRFKNNKGDSEPWIYGVFSHYKLKDKFFGTDHVIINGNCYELSTLQILPFDGNEHLVGTTQEPEPPVDLAINSPVMVLTDNNNWVYAIYKGEDDFAIGKMKVLFSNGQVIYPQIIVPHDKFDPLTLDSCIANEGLEMRDNGFLYHIKKRGEES